MINRSLFIAAFLVLTMFVAPVCAWELTSHEKSVIDRWLDDNGLNSYGDPEGTTYLGTSPLFDEFSGEFVDRYHFVLWKHPTLFTTLDIVGDDKMGVELRHLETKLEISQKDLAIALNSLDPDKYLIVRLKNRIEELRTAVYRLQKQMQSFEELHSLM